MRKGTTLGLSTPKAEWLAGPPVYAPTTLCSHLPTLGLHSISRGFVQNCANFVRYRGFQPLLPHLCPMSVP